MKPEDSAIARLRTYVRDEVVVVYKTHAAFGELSNMAAGFPISINGVRIATTEALYQACRFPHLLDLQRRIISQRSPMTAKMVGKPYRSQSRSDWDRVRVRIMRWCLRLKLAQHWLEFGRILLATKDRVIVEQSRRDGFWGALINEDDDRLLIGENVLGRLLMELREQLKIDGSTLKKVDPVDIPQFLLFGKPIDPIEAGAVGDLFRVPRQGRLDEGSPESQDN